jgi:hypothetical protein
MNNIIKILKNIYSPIQILPNHCQNERYLHHYFSNKLQNIISTETPDPLRKYAIIYNHLARSSFHPEWPSKKSIKNDTISDCGKYRYDKTSKKYIVDDENGTSGFIDFAIGDYITPEIGIEFTASFGWKGEEIIYDMMKLMDSRNPFKKVVSYNIIFREKRLPKKTTKSYDKFIGAIANSLSNYQDRLNIGIKNYYERNREYLFWIIEIGQNETRSWYCTNISTLTKSSPRNFIPGDPI